jgi:hypothetical protein
MHQRRNGSNITVKERNMVILHRCELIRTCKAHTGVEVRPDTFLTLALHTSVFSFMLRLLYRYFKSPHFPTMLDGSQSQSGQWWQKGSLSSPATKPQSSKTLYCQFISQTNKCTTYMNNVLFIKSTPTCFNASASSSGSLNLVLC